MLHASVVTSDGKFTFSRPLLGLGYTTIEDDVSVSFVSLLTSKLSLGRTKSSGKN